MKLRVGYIILDVVATIWFLLVAVTTVTVVFAPDDSPPLSRFSIISIMASCTAISLACAVAAHEMRRNYKEDE